MLRWASTTLVVLCGCTPPLQDCPKEQVELVGPTGDGNLGTFEGEISWLQTGQTSLLQLTLLPKEQTTDVDCSGTGFFSVDLAISTTDGAVGEVDVLAREVNNAGFVKAREYSLEVSAEDLVNAGKVPQAPDILSRNPNAVVTISPGDVGLLEVLIRLESTVDTLHVGMGTISKVAP